MMLQNLPSLLNACFFFWGGGTGEVYENPCILNMNGQNKFTTLINFVLS